MASGSRDPRHIITPDAFSVASELLGTPLARPWRRAAAMGVDLVAILVVGRFGWFLLGLAVAFVLFRRALRPAGDALTTGARWLTYGSLGALVLVATLVGAWVDRFGGPTPELRIEMPQGVVTSSVGQAVETAKGALALTGAKTEEEARVAARSFAQSLSEQGLSPTEIRDVLEDIAAEKDAPWARAAIMSGLDALAPPKSLDTATGDSVIVAYTQALQAGDSARRASLHEPLVEAVAGERLERQEARVERLRAENQALEDELQEERDKGVLKLLFNAADEIGLGFGWAGLYFTFFVAVWRGRTPGKRLLRIRVVRLDGKPIGWWVAFNRFGGYAASIFTGLLGFFEMFWDPNRQALHDRIAATVVIKE